MIKHLNPHLKKNKKTHLEIILNKKSKTKNIMTLKSDFKMQKSGHKLKILQFYFSKKISLILM
jgi:hypothetical protein